MDIPGKKGQQEGRQVHAVCVHVCETPKNIPSKYKKQLLEFQGEMDKPTVVARDLNTSLSKTDRTDKNCKYIEI